MAERFFTQVLSNGLTLLGQQMDQVSSVAVSVLVPAGAIYDPSGREGSAAVATEWCMRGAGDRDTRQLNDALDDLGCQHDENVQGEHIVFSTAQLGRNLADVLAIYADVLRRPRLEDATFAPSRALVMQDLASLEDEPARKCNLLLRERFYPSPLGRCVYGTAESLPALTAEAVRGHATRLLTPHRTILAAAGHIDWPALCDLAERLLGDWQGDTPPDVAPTPPAGGVTHVAKESAQQHIALAHRSVVLSDPQYYAARVAVTVLSGGMSSRLFTEVREKRGLVYHVSTRYHSLKEHAGLFTYAAAVPDKAQQTLEVTVGELRRLAEGVEDDEMTRARTQLKAALIMQGESTLSRSGSLGNDWFHLGRLRSLAEVSDAIDHVTVQDVVDYLRAYPARDFTLLTIGPRGLDPSALAG